MLTRIPILLALLLGVFGARAQTTLQQESFETDGEGSRYTSTTFDGRPGGTNAQYFVREDNPVQNPSGTPTFGATGTPITIGAVNGTMFWASEGARGQSTPAARPAQTVTLSSVNITGYTNLQVKVLMADARGPSNPTAQKAQWENDDFIRVKVSINGGAFTTIGQFVGDNSTSSLGGNLRRDTNLNGQSYDAADAASTVLDMNMVDNTFTITGTGTTIQVQVEVDQIGGTEEFAFDNIRLIGTLSATQPPVLASIESSSLTYNEGDPATNVTGTLTVADPDNSTLTGATAQITTGYVSSQDVLLFTNQNGITGSWNSTNGTMTLSGTASLANYQAALRSIRYQNTEVVNATGGTRIVTFSATDGTNTSNTVTRSINFVAQLNGPASLPYTEEFDTNGEGTRYASNAWDGQPSVCLGFLRVTTNPYTCSPVTFGNISGPGYWYSEGTKNGVNPNPIDIGNLEIAPVNATNYSNLTFSVRLGTGQSLKWDNTDYVKFYYKVGTGAWNLFGAFYGNSSLDGELQQDTDLNGSADGLTLNSTLQNVTMALPTNVTGSSIGFFIEVSSDGQEELAMDRIFINGTLMATVSSITRASANPTNAGSVNYTVTFSQSVTGVTTSNFSLTALGVSGAGISGISGSGTTRTVTVNTGSGSGTIRLDMANSTGISPSVSGLPYFSGEVYTIDKTNPTVSITSNPAALSNNPSATFQFTGNDTGGAGLNRFEAQIDGGGFVTATSPRTYTGLSDGNHSFDVRSVDNAGNVSSTASYSWTIDTTPPPSPVVSTPVNGSSTSNPQPPVTGTAQPGSTVNVIIDGSTVGSTTADAAGNWSLIPSTPLAQGSHNVRASATDAAGNTSPNSSTNNFTVDSVVPTVSITSNPANPSNSSSASFAFTGSDATSGINRLEAQLDGGGFATATSPRNYSGLADGSHTFQVRAIDNAGNVSTVASFTWVIDTQVPTVSITSNPAALSNSSSATFQFTGSDNSGGSGLNRFEAQIDGGGFVTATSPRTYTGLADGPHAFDVRSVDNAGNVSSAASFSWTVDTTPPPAPVLTAPTNGALLTSNQPTVTGTAAANSTVTVFIDGSSVGSTTANGSGNWSFATPTPLTDGLHTVRANATDAAGNTSVNSITNTFTVDTNAPNTSITSTPSNPSNDATPTFGFSGTDSGTGIDHYEGRLDGGAFTTLTSPHTFGAQVDGSHTFEVRAVDNAGNVDGSPASYTWVIDTQAPTASFSSTPPTATNSTSATFTFSATDGAGSGIDYIEGSLDGAAFTAMTSPQSFTGLADGSHNFRIRAIDNAGNVSGLSTYSWSVDTQAPNTNITSTPAALTNSTSATFQFNGTDNSGGSGIDHFEARLDGGAFGTVTSPQSYTGLADGPHTFEVRAVDNAGNADATPASYTWTIDTQAPATPFITTPTNNALLAVDQPTYSGTAEPNSTVTVIVDGSPIGTTTASGAGNWSLVQPTPLADGPHTVTATATDVVGNTGGSRIPINFTIDTQLPAAPVVVAPADGSFLNDVTPTYSGTAEAGVQVIIVVDGNTVGTVTATGGNWSFTQPSNLAQGPHTVSAFARDAANNSGPDSNTNTFTVDTQAPSVVISSPTSSPTSQNPIPVNVTFSEPVTGFTAGDVTVNNGTLTNFTGSGDSYDFDIVPTAPGTVTVTIASGVAQDAATNNNLAASPFSRVYQLAATETTWQGGGSTDWFTAGNWDNGVPTATLDAIIPAASAPYPTISSGSAIARGLTIATGGSLTVDGGTLNLKGGITINGTFSQTGGQVQLSGNALQQIGGSAMTTFQNLLVGSAGAALADPVRISQLLTLTGNLASGGNLTLLSSATATAMVVNNGGTVSGEVKVQRWIDGSVNNGLGYRHLAAPVTNTTFADLAAPGFVPLVNPAYNAAANPQSVRPYPNIFGFNEQRFPASPDFLKGYFSPTSTSDPMASAHGYTVYISGNRMVDFDGTLANGNVNRNGLTNTGNFAGVTDKSGWHLLGNPYPSPIDWDLVSVPAGMSNSVSVYQSTNGTNGIYRTRANGIGSLTEGLIPMAQGFFVRVTGGSPVNFGFTNAIRPTTYENPVLYRPGNRPTSDPRPVMSLTLRRSGAPAQEQDEAFVYFQTGASVDLDNRFDGIKPARNVGAPTLLTLSANGSELAVNGQPETALAAGTRIPLLLSLPQAGTYELRLGQLANLTAGAVALRDQQTGARWVLTAQTMVRVVASRPGDVSGRYWLEFAANGSVTGIADDIDSPSLVLYPNPTNGADAVRVLGPQAGQPIEVLDATGRRVRVLTATAEGTDVSLTNLAEGVYIIRSGAMTRRLVIE